jgi:hypothetical protein
VPENVPKLVCGVIMPISTIDGCTETHWSDVLEIVTEAIEEAGFEANLVSNADDVGIIHKRIIQNLYDNPIVVCDVSGKNPNVMFELGMRLAFDKPTVIVKDEKTTYSFDTSAIEHIEYPRDLRFSRIVEFKAKLKEKILATHKRATTDSSYTTFLKHFGEFTVAKLDKKEVSGQQFIIEELRSLRSAIRRMEFSPQLARENELARLKHPVHKLDDIDICMEGWSDERIALTLKRAREHISLDGARVVELDSGHRHLLAEVTKPGADVNNIASLLRSPQLRFLKKPQGTTPTEP